MFDLRSVLSFFLALSLLIGSGAAYDDTPDYCVCGSEVSECFPVASVTANKAAASAMNAVDCNVTTKWNAGDWSASLSVVFSQEIFANSVDLWMGGYSAGAWARIETQVSDDGVNWVSLPQLRVDYRPVTPGTPNLYPLSWGTPVQFRYWNIQVVTSGVWVSIFDTKFALRL